MRTFDNEWIFQAFEDYPSFLTNSLLGRIAKDCDAYSSMIDSE